MHSHNPNPPAPQPQDATLREEFNRWAGAGKGESMEQDHWPITRPVLAQMRIAPDDHILDLGCGAGWLSRILARGVPRGRVLGVDISDHMIRRAQEAMPAVAGPSPDAAANLEFRVGSVDAIPSDANSFTRIISVESAYYWPDPARGVREMFRVLRPGAPGRRGGSAWIVINYYRDNRTAISGAQSSPSPRTCSPPANGRASFATPASPRSPTAASPTPPRIQRFTPAAGSATPPISPPSAAKAPSSSTAQSPEQRV